MIYIIKQTSEAAHMPPTSHEIDIDGNSISEGKYRLTTTVTLTPLDPQQEEDSGVIQE